MLKSVAAGLAAFVLVIAGASANDTKPLTEDEAKRFVAALEDTHAFGKALESEGKAEALDVQLRPKAGEPFRPYTNAVAAMKEKLPGEHAQLSKVVGAHGFTAENWASTGDRVMVAYMAERMARDNPDAMAQMAAMDASMLNMLPPEMKAQIEPMLAIANAVKDAPPADRAAVRPVMGDLDAYLETAGGDAAL